MARQSLWAARHGIPGRGAAGGPPAEEFGP
jgi:hypothetical protein